jgi:hypothetical protein
MTENSLINLGEISKPATVLIEKISNAVGGIFKPYQIVRVAKAEADADRIHAESQIQVTDLQRRAMHRFLEEEAKKQANIDSITEKALSLLEEQSCPANMEDDWITNFFDKSRIVSDAEMQELWSRVLASEANTPGTFSRRTVNLLSDLDKRDAELFTKLCGFGWMIVDVAPLVFDVKGELYNHHGISFDSLLHLETLGLLQFDDFVGFTRFKLPKKVTMSYFNTSVELEFSKDALNTLDVGKVVLTHAGQELARICDPKPVEGFFDLVYKRWEEQSLILRKNPEPSPSAAI